MDSKTRNCDKKNQITIFDVEKNIFDFDIGDSTLLVYSFFKPYDSTLLMILNANGSVVKGKICFYPPTYYSDLPNLDRRKSISYNSINLILSHNDWDSLYAKLTFALRSMSRRKTDLFDNLHPAIVKLYFNSKGYSIEDYTDSSMYKIRAILYNQILSDLLELYPKPRK